MFQMSLFREVRKYYNKFLTNVKRATTSLKLEIIDDSLIHTIAFGNMAIKATVKGDNTTNFAPQSVNFGEWYTSLDAEEKDGTVDVTSEETGIMLGKTLLSSVYANSGSSVWTPIAVLSTELFSNSIVINNTCAKKGMLKCNCNTFIKISNNKCYIINTNDVLTHGNVFDADIGEYLFGIPNEYMANLKKWLLFSNNESEDVELSICQMGVYSFLKLEFASDGEIIYETIFPIEISDSCKKAFNFLHKVINNNTWGKTPIDFDESDMYEVCVKEGFSMLVESGKTFDKKTIKKQFDAFVKEKDKAVAFRKKDYKELKDKIDTTYLSVAKSIGEDNLYILRTLYTDFMSAISDFDYEVYFLDTEAKALYFEHEDDFFSFKSLFMLRKPKEAILDISDEDIELEEEIQIDFEVFEPT